MPCYDFRVSHNYYRGGGSPITFVMSRRDVEFHRSQTDFHGEIHLMNVVNNTLYEMGARYPGTVHSWRYCNGDVRYTFQPEKPSGSHGR